MMQRHLDENPPMNFDHPPADPLTVFDEWFRHAELHAGLPNPNAMTVATANVLIIAAYPVGALGSFSFDL